MQLTAQLSFIAVALSAFVSASPVVARDGSHNLKIVNSCTDSVTPFVLNYSDGAQYTGPQPTAISPSGSTQISVPQGVRSRLPEYFHRSS